jgi:hypothetical protein
MNMNATLNNPRGAAAVEFAIVLPLLVMFVFGIVEFGIVFYNKAMITNASREAARAAIVHRAPALDVVQMKDEVKSAIVKYLGNPADPPNSLLIPTNAPWDQMLDETKLNFCNDAGDEINVTLEWDYSFIMLPDFLTAWFGGGLPGTIKISAITKMRCE